VVFPPVVHLLKFIDLIDQRLVVSGSLEKTVVIIWLPTHLLREPGNSIDLILSTWFVQPPLDACHHCPSPCEGFNRVPEGGKLRGYGACHKTWLELVS